MKPSDTTLPLSAGTSVTWLTVNRRLASEYRRRYDAARQREGLQVWPSPDILPWDAWLDRLYVQLLDAGHIALDLLSTTQERLLWQEVIEHAVGRHGLLRPAAAAQSAQATARLYVDWQLERHPLHTLGSDETRIFLDWHAAFEQTLAARALLTRSRLPALLGTAFAQHRLTPPRQLQLSGFDALAPTQQALLNQLAALGCEVLIDDIDSATATGTRIEADDREHEIQLAAAWAAQRLRDDSTQRIAIVVPQLTQYRSDLARIFAAQSSPAYYLLQRDTQQIFNVSLGLPLTTFAPVAAAIKLLTLSTDSLSLGEVGQLLRSPFVGGHAAEWDGRARVDAALRELGAPSFTLRGLHSQLSRFAADDARHCPDLRRRLEHVTELSAALPARDTPNGWAGHLQHLLALFGWPGDRALDSAEYQAHERVRRLFSEFAALGKVRSELHQREAVHLLRSLAADTVFQPESSAAPIQILGPLEAAGITFDAVWLLGADDQCWPPSPQPDPLLPSALQRELGMPHASAERELTFARSVTARLAQGCSQLVASHARKEGDREQRPSALIREWPCVEPATLGADGASGVHALCSHAGQVEEMPAAHATPAPASQAGGAGLLAAQAACPFKAVVQYRLAATPLAEASHAMDGADIGRLVHDLLQRIWQQIGSSRRLAAMTDDVLAQIVAPLAAAVVADLGRRRPDLFGARFQAIEAERLTGLVCEWLTVERDRPQAFEVAALERKQRVEIAGLQLDTRVDRIDRLADGSLAVIDYKTGRQVRIDSWFDARPGEPQLPLYCLQQTDDVSAALLARVRHGKPGCAFVGLSRDAGFAPGVETAGAREGFDWPATLQHWQRALSDLAREVVAGRAEATPSREACTYCPFGALCRVRGHATEEADV